MIVVEYSVYGNDGWGTAEQVVLPAELAGPMCHFRHLFGSCTHHSCGMVYSSQRAFRFMFTPAVSCNHAVGEPCSGTH